VLFLPGVGKKGNILNNYFKDKALRKLHDERRRYSTYNTWRLQGVSSSPGCALQVQTLAMQRPGSHAEDSFEQYEARLVPWHRSSANHGAEDAFKFYEIHSEKEM
jgi:hypothetical protein